MCVNEPNGKAAPPFYFGRTSQGNAWRLRHDVPDPIAFELEKTARDEPIRSDLREAPRNLRRFQQILWNDPARRAADFGPAYRFPGNLPVPTNVTRVTRSDLTPLLGLWKSVEEIQREFDARQPICVVMEDGMAVSQCFSSRLTDRAAAAGVQTLEGYRGRGYAPSVVAAWGNIVQETGRVPLYDTWWENLASQAVARKLGLIHYATMVGL